MVHTCPLTTSTSSAIVVDDKIKQDLQQMVDLIKNLSLNFMNYTGGHSCGRGLSQGDEVNNQQETVGDMVDLIDFLYGIGGELGHYANECDGPPCHRNFQID